MLRFIVDHNVGKLARWLRMMGFDSLFFTGGDDSAMIRQALAGGRVILTRDTEIGKRRVINSGRVRAVVFRSESPEQQIRHLLSEFDLMKQSRPFTLCLECNQPLAEKSPDDVRERVPPYVFATQTQFMECPACRRVYWRGTHWEAMRRKLEELAEESSQR
jgi:uncharacterized protein with PIN domain